MIDRHGKYRSPGAETELESPMARKNAIQIPIANRAAANAAASPASLSKTPRVKLVSLEAFLSRRFRSRLATTKAYDVSNSRLGQPADMIEGTKKAATQKARSRAIAVVLLRCPAMRSFAVRCCCEVSKSLP